MTGKSCAGSCSVRRLVLVSVRAGLGLPEHAAAGPASVYVISGRVQFHEGDQEVTAAAGSLLCLTPGQPHKLQAKEDSRLLVTLVKPPDPAAWNASLAAPVA